MKSKEQTTNEVKEQTTNEVFENLVRQTVGDAVDMSLEDEEPTIDSVEVDKDKLHAFMGQCHCSAASAQ